MGDRGRPVVVMEAWGHGDPTSRLVDALRTAALKGVCAVAHLPCGLALLNSDILPLKVVQFHLTTRFQLCKIFKLFYLHENKCSWIIPHRLLLPRGGGPGAGTGKLRFSPLPDELN